MDVRKKTDTRRWGDGRFEKMFEMDVSGERLGREKDRGGGEKKLLSERIFSLR
jgi:hypothetical protein